MAKDNVCSWINKDVTIPNGNIGSLGLRDSELTGVHGHKAKDGKHPSNLKMPFSPEPTRAEPEVTEDGDMSCFECSTTLHSRSCSGRTYIGSPTESRRCEISLLAALSSERLRPDIAHMFHGFKDSIFVVCQRLLHFSEGSYEIGVEELRTHEKTVENIARHFVDFEHKLKEQQAIVAELPSRMIFTVATHDDNIFVVWRLRSQALEKALTLPLVEEDRSVEAFYFYFNTCLHLPLTKIRSVDRHSIVPLLASLERLTYAITRSNELYSDLRVNLEKLRQTYIDSLTTKIQSSAEIQGEIRRTKQTLDNAAQASPPRDPRGQAVTTQTLAILSSNLNRTGFIGSAKSRRLRKELTV